MIHPAVVYYSQEDHSLDFSHLLAADFGFLLCIDIIEDLPDVVLECFFVEVYQVILTRIEPVSECRCDLSESIHYSLEVPLLGVLGFHDDRVDYSVDQLVCHVFNIAGYVLAVEHHASLIVDDLTLLVHYVVVLQNVFTDTEVLAFDFLLGALYRP